MDMKVEILSKEFVKPASPTPDHLKNYKLSMLDQLSPQQYVPIVLFYSPTSNHSKVIQTLKKSLSQSLTSLYPFAGRMRLGNTVSIVECNDEGALFVEAQVPETELSMIIETNEAIGLLYKFLPFHPYGFQKRPMDKDDYKQEPVLMLGIQFNKFSCGSIAIGVCIYHKIADAATLSFFLASWAASEDARVSPDLNAASLFPPRDVHRLIEPSSRMICEKGVVTKRFVFDATSLANLKSKVGNINEQGDQATKVESVTALIWKSAMEASKLSSRKETLPKSLITHLVNVRPRIQPPLLYNTVGNFWQITIALLVEKEDMKEIELGCLAARIRKATRKIDSDHVREVQGDNGVAKSFEPIEKVMLMICKGEVEQAYNVSSWAKFPFYEIDFGWGKPIWVSTNSGSIKNFVNFLSTRSGDGIEALVSLLEQDMVEFETNPELCQFLSHTSA